jgi:Carboxypeptidase regulatory-like domain
LRGEDRLRAVAHRLAALVVLGSLSASAFAGEIVGRVSLKGPPPVHPPMDRSSDPACPPPSSGDQPVIVSASGGLRNAVVRVRGAGPSSASAFPVALAPITVEQRGCSYVPRVQAALRGQPLWVENGDPVLHNLHAFAGRKGLFNVAQPARSAPVKRDLDVEIVRLKCDVHPWMFGWVVFNETPYFAVTATDGRFTIQGVPPGTYTLSAWHETFGTQELNVTVADEAVRADFEFDASRAVSP